MRGKLLTTKLHQAANENLCLTDRGKTNLMGCAVHVKSFDLNRISSIKSDNFMVCIRISVTSSIT